MGLVGERRPADALLWLESILSDVRVGLRVLRKNATVTMAAVISLAVAIGACISAFAVLDALILRPLPVRDPNRLVQLTYPTDVAGVEGEMFSRPLLDRFRSRVSGGVELFGVSYQGVRPVVFDRTGAQEEQVRAQWVSGNMFQALGVGPAIGRTLSETDDAVGAGQAAVLSHPFWLGRFGGSPDIIGRWFTFPGSDHHFQIVGVADAGFTGVERGRLTDIWIPSVTWRMRELPWYDWLRIFGRLKPPVEAPQIQFQLQSTFSDFRRDRVFGADEPRDRVERYHAMPLHMRSAANGPSSVQQQFERPLWILMLVVMLVFIIAGSNVGNLFFARALAREHEMSLRLSIGATRIRLVQQVLIESALIAAGAALVGWLFAAVAAPAIIQMLAPSENPLYADLRNDWRLVAFVIAIAAATVGAFGLTPALRASGVSPMGALKAHSSRTISGVSLLRPLAGLQVAFSVVVLFVAGLFVSSFARLSAVDLGFTTNNLLVATVESRGVNTSDRGWLAGQHLIEDVRRMPHVDSASLAGWAPFRSTGTDRGLTVRMRIPHMTDVVEAAVQRVTTEFFQTTGIPLRDGRTFTPQDEHASPVPIIVNEAFARRLDRVERVVGRRLGRIEEHQVLEQEIVGVVGNARSGDLRKPVPPTVYDLAAGIAPIQTLLVRTSGDPLAVASDLLRQVPQIDPSLRVTEVIPQSRLVDDALLRERALALLSGFLAMVGLLLTAVGLYGILSYSVVRRTRDIGVRLALGADPQRLARWAIMDIAKVVGAGLVVGLAAGLVVAPLLVSLLYGVQPWSFWSLAAPVGALLLAAALAAVPPARRAARIDPVVALRYE
jgi:predicted permease